MRRESGIDQAALESAIDVLGKEFPALNWNFRPEPRGGSNEQISQWLGDEKEEVIDMCKAWEEQKNKSLAKVYNQ